MDAVEWSCTDCHGISVRNIGSGSTASDGATASSVIR